MQTSKQFSLGPVAWRLVRPPVRPRRRSARASTRGRPSSCSIIGRAEARARLPGPLCSQPMAPSATDAPSLEARRHVTDLSLSALVLVLVAEAAVTPSLVELGLVGRHLSDASFMGLLAIAVWLLFDSSRLGRVLVVAAVGCAGLRVANLDAPDASLRLANALLAGFVLLLLAALALRYTLADGRFNLHRVAGAIAGYLALGLAFAQAHRLVAMHAEGAYLLLGQPAGYSTIVPRLNYFSFVVLTSLGFGDITPAHAVARSLTVLQSLVGVLYPAALVGWVVARVGRPPRT